MQRATPLMIDETYHVFNRGAHKQPIFLEDLDYLRFQTLLFLSNSSAPVVVRDVLKRYKGESFVRLFENEKREAPLVDILAYSLMPNHFHLVLRPIVENGVSVFMRKLGTAYSMYFNLQHEHSGTLFQGPFKSSHIDTDPYHTWIFAYAHLSPVSLIAPKWQEHGVENIAAAQHFLANYRYSSYFDYYTAERPERATLAYEEAIHYIDKKDGIESLLADYSRGEALHSELVTTEHAASGASAAVGA